MTDVQTGQLAGADLERIRDRFKRWSRRRYAAAGAFGAVVVLAILANAIEPDALRILIPLTVGLGFTAAIYQELWWRCPRCHTSLTGVMRFRLRALSVCPSCGLDLGALSRPDGQRDAATEKREVG